MISFKYIETYCNINIYIYKYIILLINIINIIKRNNYL